MQTTELNAKLVQFNPKGFKTFIAWHGNSNYEQINQKIYLCLMLMILQIKVMTF
jgi:hypothetical protein